MGVTLPVDGNKDHLLQIKGFKPKEVAIGNWAEDLPVAFADKDTYRELPIPGVCNQLFMSRYMQRTEGPRKRLLSFPNLPKSCPRPALLSDLLLPSPPKRKRKKKRNPPK